MEDALREVVLNLEKDANEKVLILVVMEDALRVHAHSLYKGRQSSVLILVVMEDALREGDIRHRYA